ncbi:hypothetical protein DYST_01366 [Dyella terrae]|nr:hypothetical protein DYST_01366 [Dyella terrae]
MHEWYKRNRVSGRQRRLFFFGIAVFAYMLAEFRIIHLPTLLNGGFFPITQDRMRPFVGIMNSRLVMPVFAWFVPFGTLCLYWAVLHFVVNTRMIWATTARCDAAARTESKDLTPKQI